MLSRPEARGDNKKMKIIELYAVPTIHVDDFCDHQIIGEDIHAIGYGLRRDPDGGEVYGVVEVRMVMNAKKFFDACRRGVEMAETGHLPPETASTHRH
jgi:hypothetical protein